VNAGAQIVLKMKNPFISLNSIKQCLLETFKEVSENLASFGGHEKASHIKNLKPQ